MKEEIVKTNVRLVYMEVEDGLLGFTVNPRRLSPLDEVRISIRWEDVPPEGLLINVHRIKPEMGLG